MPRKNKLLASLLACLVLLPVGGCWDYKNIDRMNYLTVMGIDYDEGRFEVFLQSSHFAGVAMGEKTLNSSKPRDVVGIGRGKSIGEAIFEVYKAEQITVYWGHIKTIIFSKRALQHVGYVDLTDLINRYREIRYNIWVFGTEEPIAELLNHLPFYGRSFNDSLLMKPYDTYKQYSHLKPVYLYRFISDSTEKGKTAILPELATNRSDWREGGKTIPLLYMSGAYFMKGTNFLGDLDEELLQGLRYLDGKMFRVPLSVGGEGKPTITFVVRKLDHRVRYEIREGQIRYKLDVKVKAFIDEMLDNAGETAMKRLVEQEIEKSIRLAYNEGKKIHADVLNLGYPLFKHHYPTWKTYVRPGDGITDSTLGNIRVKARITHSGKYKGRISDQSGNNPTSSLRSSSPIMSSHSFGLLGSAE